MEMNWISVKEKLPEIPPGKFGINVIAAVYDSVYAELSGNGYDVYEVTYSVLEGKTTPTFNTLGYGTTDTKWLQITDEVTHWMYKPKPPGYPLTNKLTLDDLIAGIRIQSTITKYTGVIESYKDETYSPCKEQFPSHGFFLRIQWDNGMRSTVPLNKENQNDVEWFENLKLIKL